MTGAGKGESQIEKPVSLYGVVGETQGEGKAHRNERSENVIESEAITQIALTNYSDLRSRDP